MTIVKLFMGEMEAIDAPLKSIVISDQGDEEVQLLADFPINLFCGLGQGIAFALLAGLLAMAFAFSTDTTYTTQKEPLRRNNETNPFLVTTDFTNLGPSRKFVRISCYFDGQSDRREIPLSGSVVINTKRDGISTNSFEGEIKSTKLDISPLNWSSTKVPLYYTDLVSFDTLSIQFTLFTPDTKLKTITFELATVDPGYEKALSISQLLITLVFAVLAFANLIKFSSKTFEQRLTIFLLIGVALCADPLSVFTMDSPSTTGRVVSLVTKDIFYAYTAFYLMAIFSFFGRTQGSSKVVSVALPMTVGLLVLILLAAVHITMPGDSPVFQTIVLCVYDAIYFVYSALIRAKVEETQMRRFRNYSLLSFGFLSAMTVFVVLKVFTEMLEGLTIQSFFPLALCAFFGVIMQTYHSELDERQRRIAYKAQEPSEIGDSNPIGVDEDLALIEEKNEVA